MIRLILVSVLLLAGCSKQYTSGVDYYLVNPPLELIEPGAKGVEVVEVFWYGCSSCFNFEPKFKIWQAELGKKVNVIKMPAPLNEDWTKHAKIFWSAMEMGLSEQQFSDLVYKEIHTNRNSLLTPMQVDRFLTANHIDTNSFNIAYNSRQVNSKIEFSENYLRKVGVRTVPAIVIDGKYLVLENGQPEKMLEVADYLVSISEK